MGFGKSDAAGQVAPQVCAHVLKYQKKFVELGEVFCRFNHVVQLHNRGMLAQLCQYVDLSEQAFCVLHAVKNPRNAFNGHHRIAFKVLCLGDRAKTPRANLLDHMVIRPHRVKHLQLSQMLCL